PLPDDLLPAAGISLLESSSVSSNSLSLSAAVGFFDRPDDFGPAILLDERLSRFSSNSLSLSFSSEMPLSAGALSLTPLLPPLDAASLGITPMSASSLASSAMVNSNSLSLSAPSFSSNSLLSGFLPEIFFDDRAAGGAESGATPNTSPPLPDLLPVFPASFCRSI